MRARVRLFTGALVAVFAFGGPAVAGTSPKHGGTLEFAVTVEPGNFDCHGNISFAFLHPIAPITRLCSNSMPPIIRRSSAI
jgi:hypothetical protein